MTATDNHPTVFVLDADDAVHSNYEQVLSNAGYLVVTLDGGCAKLDAVMQAKPDVVVADLRHTCDECLELIHEIRKGGGHIAIVVIAASPTVRNAVDALKAGADEILPGPFSPDELKAAVAVALQQRRDLSC